MSREDLLHQRDSTLSVGEDGPLSLHIPTSHLDSTLNTIHDRPLSLHIPASRSTLPPLRLHTISGTLSEDTAPRSPHQQSPSSPRHLSATRGRQHPALRRATLLMRASRSTASLQSRAPWPPPPPSRTQSLNLPPSPDPPPPVFPSLSYGGAGAEQPAESGPDGSLTPTGLSWRRLHVSRAKLKATATTSELLSGFAMVAMVELQINEGTKVPEWLFVLFSICTTVLVAVHIFALMISTYILPSIDAVSRLHTGALVSESPHERMRWFIELAWGFSTVLGLFLFLVEVAILCWVKFWDYSFAAALASTVIVVPSLAIFVGFAVHFYHTLVVHKCEASDMDLKQLENMRSELEKLGKSGSDV